ncbi:MAG: hypothetical protein Kow00121_36780 [Elainellaceae cyanobacterium]
MDAFESPRKIIRMHIASHLVDAIKKRDYDEYLTRLNNLITEVVFEMEQITSLDELRGWSQVGLIQEYGLTEEDMQWVSDQTIQPACEETSGSVVRLLLDTLSKTDYIEGKDYYKVFSTRIRILNQELAETLANANPVWWDIWLFQGIVT